MKLSEVLMFIGLLFASLSALVMCIASMTNLSPRLSVPIVVLGAAFMMAALAAQIFEDKQ